MELNIDIYNLLILFGTLQAFVFGSLLVARSNFKEATKYLGICVLFLACYLIWVLKASLGIQAYYPQMRFLPLLFLWGIGPAFYAYLRFYFRKPISSKSLKRHFFPLLVEQLFFNSATFLFYINSWDPNNFNDPEAFLASNVFEIEHYIGLLSIAIYLILSMRLYGKEIKTGENKRIGYILICFTLLWSIWMPYTIVDAMIFDFNFPVSEFYPFYILLTALTYAIGFIGFQLSKQIITGRKPEKTSEMKKLAEIFTTKMETEKYYLDPNLSLQSFSERLDIHPNKSSAVINVMMDYSFRDFVNSYRIEEFKTLANTADVKSKTILGIALDAGFNSKASFNRAFRKFCHSSPAEYLEKRQISGFKT